MTKKIAIMAIAMALAIAVGVGCGPEGPLSKECYQKLEAAGVSPEGVRYIESQPEMDYWTYMGTALGLKSQGMGVCIIPRPEVGGVNPSDPDAIRLLAMPQGRMPVQVHGAVPVALPKKVPMPKEK